MAEFVSHSDYDWFTPADLTRVIDAIHALPDWRSVVLVGGQSLTAWVEYYKIQLPAFEGPYLTTNEPVVKIPLTISGCRGQSARHLSRLTYHNRS